MEGYSVTLACIQFKTIVKLQILTRLSYNNFPLATMDVGQLSTLQECLSKNHYTRISQFGGILEISYKNTFTKLVNEL